MEKPNDTEYQRYRKYLIDNHRLVPPDYENPYRTGCISEEKLISAWNYAKEQNPDLTAKDLIDEGVNPNTIYREMELLAECGEAEGDEHSLYQANISLLDHEIYSAVPYNVASAFFVLLEREHIKYEKADQFYAPLLGIPMSALSNGKSVRAIPILSKIPQSEIERICDEIRDLDEEEIAPLETWYKLYPMMDPEWQQAHQNKIDSESEKEYLLEREVMANAYDQEYYKTHKMITE